MIRAIEVKQWDYEVYFKRNTDWQARLVRVFDSEAEALKCQEKIINDLGVHAWYVSKLKLEVY